MFLQNAFYDGSQFAHLVQSDESIDFRQLLSQFFGKSLRHTTAYDQSLVRPFVQATLLMRL